MSDFVVCESDADWRGVGVRPQQRALSRRETAEASQGRPQKPWTVHSLPASCCPVPLGGLSTALQGLDGLDGFHGSHGSRLAGLDDDGEMEMGMEMGIRTARGWDA